MIGSNHFNLPQDRLHCDYVTNILQKEIETDIWCQAHQSNALVMFY